MTTTAPSRDILDDLDHNARLVLTTVGEVRAVCVVPGCARPMRRKRDGMCDMHRRRVDKYGDPSRTGAPIGEHADARAALVVRLKTAEAWEPGACWDWPFDGTLDDSGYGRWPIGGRKVRAHRVALSIALGRDLQPGAHVLHSCDNPRCVRPSHLREGTHAENMREAALRRRFSDMRGERNHSVKLTDAQCDEIRRRRDAGERVATIATTFGVDRSTIHRIVANKRGLATVAGRRFVKAVS